MVANEDNRYVATIPGSAVSESVVEYYIVAEDSDGNIAYSGTAENPYRIAITGAPTVAISAQPVSVSVTVGQTATFTVEAAGSGLKYQWQYRTSSTGTWRNSTASDSKTDTLSVSAAAYRNGYQYRCVVTDVTGNTVASEAATLTVEEKILAAPKVTASNVASSGAIKLTWNAVEGAVKYEVYRSTSENGTYTKLWTTTGTKMTNTGAESGVTYYYKVKAIASNSAANSAYSAIQHIMAK